MTPAETAAMAREYGFSSDDEMGGSRKRQTSQRENKSEEKTSNVDNANALMA